MIDAVSRRAILSSLAALPLLGSTRGRSELSVEGYIFQQYASEQKRPLGEVIPDVLKMVSDAGYKNVELNPSFLTPELRDRTLQLIRKYRLRMPSVYVGGALHQERSAATTMEAALSTAELCRPFECRAVVNNPDPKPGDEPKTDSELNVQASALNRMGRELAVKGFELRVHHHTPQLEHNAREWRHILHNTDPQYVKLCVDVDWAYEAGFAALPFLREAGDRVHELHVRSARNKVWLEDVEDSDIDYRAVANYLKHTGLLPLIVVELAHRPATVITRTLEQNLLKSREYVQQVFAGVLKAS